MLPAQVTKYWDSITYYVNGKAYKDKQLKEIKKAIANHRQQIVYLEQLTEYIKEL